MNSEYPNFNYEEEIKPNLPYQKYKLKIDKSDSTNWPTSQNNEKIIIKVDGSIGHKVIISKENNNERNYFDFYKYDDSNYKDAFATDSPRSMTGTNSRKVSFEKAFVNEYNDTRNSHNTTNRSISGFQTEFSKFFASNSFTNPTSSNNAFSYLRSNVINKDNKYYSPINIAYL